MAFGKTQRYLPSQRNTESLIRCTRLVEMRKILRCSRNTAPMYLIGLGFLTGIIMILDLADDSPLGFVILYPIWCILTGSNILRSVNTIK
jgi:hypothetical protein